VLRLLEYSVARDEDGGGGSRATRHAPPLPLALAVSVFCHMRRRTHVV
jgi:hypothetical protein